MGGDCEWSERGTHIKQFGVSLQPCASMDQIIVALEPLKQFSKDSVRLVKRCTKPDRKEIQKIAIATAIGFAIMGFIGFFVKLIHIPINNIIVVLSPHAVNCPDSSRNDDILYFVEILCLI